MSDLPGGLREISERWQSLLQLLRFTDDAGDGVHTCKSHYLLLYALARLIRPRVAVEIGSRRGGSAAWIGRALAEDGDGRLWCVDPFVDVHGGSPRFRRVFEENLRALGLWGRVTLVEKRSDAALGDVPQEVDFLFVDGDHSLEGCAFDLEHYAPRVRSGGAVAIHDYRTEPGVLGAIQRSKALVPLWALPLETPHGLWVGLGP